MIEVLRKVKMEQNINCSLKCRKETGRGNVCFVFCFLTFYVVCAQACHGTHTEVRGQLVGVKSLFLPYGIPL